MSDETRTDGITYEADIEARVWEHLNQFGVHGSWDAFWAVKAWKEAHGRPQRAPWNAIEPAVWAHLDTIGPAGGWHVRWAVTAWLEAHGYSKRPEPAAEGCDCDDEPEQ